MLEDVTDDQKREILEILESMQASLAHMERDMDAMKADLRAMNRQFEAWNARRSSREPV